MGPSNMDPIRSSSCTICDPQRGCNYLRIPAVSHLISTLERTSKSSHQAFHPIVSVVLDRKTPYGMGSQEHHLPTTLLVQHSGYFRGLISAKAFSVPSNVTTTESTVPLALKGVHPGVFAVFLDVLYTDSIAPRKRWRHAYPDITARERGAAGSFYVQLYVFAQEYEVPRMSELVLENVTKRYLPTPRAGPILPETDTIEVAVEKLPPDDQLTWVLADAYHQWLRREEHDLQSERTDTPYQYSIQNLPLDFQYKLMCKMQGLPGGNMRVKVLLEQIEREKGLKVKITRGYLQAKNASEKMRAMMADMKRWEEKQEGRGMGDV